MELFFGAEGVGLQDAPCAKQPRAYLSVSGSVPDCQASQLRGISLLPSLHGRVGICSYTASPSGSLVRPFDLHVFLLLMRCRPCSVVRAFCSLTSM